jgi:very-short-patch-repair endonuclease
MGEAVQKAVVRLFQMQHGVISYRQARAVGLSQKQIARSLHTGKWTELFSGTFRHTASPRLWLGELRAAILCAGSEALATHRSALRLYGFKDFLADPCLEISVRGSVRPQPGLIIHRRHEDWRPRPRLIQGIPTSGIITTLFDLAALGDRERLGPAIDYAVYKKWIRTKQLAEELKRIGGQGRRGVPLMRELLADRGEGTESMLETDLAVLLKASKLPYPKHQVNLLDVAGKFVARADYAFTKAKLAIFTDGYETHSGLDAFDHDRDVDNRLMPMGWSVLRFTKRMIRRDPANVIERITETLSLRGAARAEQNPSS